MYFLFKILHTHSHFQLAIKAVIAANYDSVVTTIEGVVDSLDNMPGLTVCEVEEEPDAGVIIAW